MLIRYFLLALFFSSIIASFAQKNLKFVRYTKKHGLVNNDVLSICEDKHGFIWFGTKKGVSRFDGIKFKNYNYSSKRKGSLGAGWVNHIVADKDSNLWFGLTGKENVLLRYDEQSDSFIDEGERLSKILGIQIQNFWKFAIDNSNRLWLSGGVEYIDLASNETKKLFGGGGLRGLVKDKNGHTWIATSDDGLFLYDEEGGFLYNYKNDPENSESLNTNSCYDLFFDSENKLWVGTDNGLAKLISKPDGKMKFRRFMHDKNNEFSISSNKVYCINEDTNGNLLIATVDGLSVFDKKTGIFTRYYTDELDNQSINSNLIRQIFRDSRGNIWLTTNQGVAKLQQINFQSFSQSSYKNSITHDKVQYICAGPENKLWIASPKGIDVYNMATGQFRFAYGVTKNKNGLYGSPVVLTHYGESELYVGTWSGGFSKVNYKTNKIINYNTLPKTKDLKNVFCVYIDHNKNLWVTASHKGVFCFDESRKIMRQFSNDPGNNLSISSNRVRVVFQDTKERLWFGTLNGFSLLLDKEKGIFKNYLPGIQIYQIVEAENNTYWIGSDDGLYKFNESTGESEKIILYEEKETIHGILIDSQNNLWISATSGFAKFTYKQDGNHEISAFREEEGLNIGDLLPYSCAKFPDGRMAFGGTKGFCIFNPDNIDKDTLPPKILFTDIKIANKSILPGEEINGQIILERPVTETTKLVLNYKNNAFSIEFAAIQYNMPQYNQYEYFLEGYDPEGSEWHATDANNRAAKYMNLPPGDYTFKLKAANCNGVWNPKPAILYISIMPPWWQTWWFRVLVVFVLLTSVLSFYFYRVNALKRQKRILEQKVNERTQELREANSQLEEKQEEILQQNEEIITVNNQLRTKNEEIEAQKEEIQSSRDQLEKAFNNITLLSEFGQKITATFDFDAINSMIYKYVSSLMDTSAFGIGLYNEKRKIIDFPYFMENSKPIPYFYKDLSNEQSLSVKCFKNSEEILINDLSQEYQKYLEKLPETQASNLPSSVIHLPLLIENKPIGTITVNSFKKNAFKESDVANLRTLASYISIALDNSKAYRIIRSKNEQINGSIRYGQTIQQAMLPPKHQLDKVFENFVIFRPKDIVSGDFYWFASVNNPLNPQGLDSDNTKTPDGFEMGYYFLAVIDCTGHGVPGAFMSMIGSRLLNDIVIERKIYSPAKILEELDTKIQKALRQDTTDNHDGMDLCLCRLQQKEDAWELTYAGAKRPLIFFNSTTQKVEEIQGTRRSIGGIISRNSKVRFTESRKKITNEDVLYLSTDGFEDQCNSKKRKYTHKRLISLIKKIHNNPLAEQKNIIENDLDNFQEGFEQRDDITLVGAKLMDA